MKIFFVLLCAAAAASALLNPSYFVERSAEDVLRGARRLVEGDQLSQLPLSRRLSPDAGPICVTGADGGIGKEIVREFEDLGYEVIPCGRSQFDLGNLEETAIAGEEISKKKPSALVLNAGVWPSFLEYSDDELEIGFQVNHLSQYLLSKIIRAPRVVILSSVAHAFCDELRLEDVNWENRKFDSTLSYAATKLMNLLQGEIAVHPGFVSTTGLFRSLSPRQLLNSLPDPFGLLPRLPNNLPLPPSPKTPRQAARDVVYATLDLHLHKGVYLSDGVPTPTSTVVTPTLAAELKTFSDDLLRKKLPESIASTLIL